MRVFGWQARVRNERERVGRREPAPLTDPDSC